MNSLSSLPGSSSIYLHIKYTIHYIFLSFSMKSLIRKGSTLIINYVKVVWLWRCNKVISVDHHHHHSDSNYNKLSITKKKMRGKAVSGKAILFVSIACFFAGTLFTGGHIWTRPSSKLQTLVPPTITHDIACDHHKRVHLLLY